MQVNTSHFGILEGEEYIGGDASYMKEGDTPIFHSIKLEIDKVATRIKKSDK